MSLRLISHSKNISLTWIYYILVVSSVSFLMMNYLKLKGTTLTSYKKSTFLIIGTILFTSSLLLIPQYLNQPQNCYEIIGVPRGAGNYYWGKRYHEYLQLHRDGKLTDNDWSSIDQAYDILYNEKLRVLYDTWGPESLNTRLDRTSEFFNFALYYIMWIMTMVSFFQIQSAKGASKYAFVGIIVVFVLDISVRWLAYDPKLFLFPFSTPFEIVCLLQLIYPIYFMICIFLSMLFYNDLKQARNKILLQMLENNRANTTTLQVLRTQLLEKNSHYS